MDCKKIDTPMDLTNNHRTTNQGEQIDENTPYRELVGALMYLPLFTRPDINEALNQLARHQTNSMKEHWKRLKRIFHYLQGTRNFGLFFEIRTNDDPLVGYSDVDQGDDLEDQKSTLEHILKVYGSIVGCKTKKQSSVALSTCEAKYISLAEAVSETLWLKGLA